MAGDPHFNSVDLLLHCEGADGSTTFTDSSDTGHTVTANGNAQVDTAVAIFGSASCLLDGTGDYLSSTTPALGSGSWTVEGQFRWSALPSSGNYSCLFSLGNATNYGLLLWLRNSGGVLNLSLYISNNGTSWDISNATLGTKTTWAVDTNYPVAISFDGSAYRVFVSGAVDITVLASSAVCAQTYWNIGWHSTSFPAAFAGHLDEIRFTKGIARYTGTYTPQTAAFPDYQENAGTGALVSAAATIAGSGSVTGERTGTGALVSQSATLSGTGRAFTTLTGTGALISQAPSISGLGGLPVQGALPITMGVLQPVVVGLPIRIDIYSAVTPTLPVVMGRYPVAPTLPIRIDVLRAATLPSLPITISGKWTDTNFVVWTPKCVLDGTDISSLLIGAQDIEFEEDAAPIASFGFIPAAGVVDPLVWVGKSVRLYWVTGSTEVLAFSGVVSDPVWNAEDRTITVSATGDLQSRLDAMEKTAIATLVGGSFSEYIFDDPDNMSGYDYAEARVSTTANVLWQDAQGWIRTTSVLAKASADYTFTNSTILDAARVVRWQGRMDFINTLYLTLGYRFKRRRERRMIFDFRPWQLETPSTYLSGNEGGWELPQRSQIESAANGGGWTVIGDIAYGAVWPNGYYPTYSDSGVAMMEGISFSPEVSDELCISARWTAAKRWLQSVTENYSLVITASDSIEAVGVLATEESYAIEDEADDETWESSLDFDDYVSGAELMTNGVDKKADLATLRSDVTAATACALAKGQNEVLKSHRGTTVSFLTTFHPLLDLSHTVAVDTTYLDAKGKVRRLAHHWDIDTGDATTEVEIALSRHNGTGTASTDPLTPPSEPADPDETVPGRFHALLMHIGGQSNFPEWDEAWDGYAVNVPFSETGGNNTLLGSWERNPANPQVAPRIYEEGFHILPPQIDAEYADPVDVTGAATYDVEIPEDTLTLISG